MTEVVLFISAAAGVVAALFAVHRLQEANGTSRFLYGTAWLGVLFAAQRVNTAVIGSVVVREIIALCMGLILLWLAYGRPRHH